ncbi:MAG: acyl-CoA thioester hydrolase/BAAT C-terminal domain-containing protein [Gaiellaceae bacterium]
MTKRRAYPALAAAAVGAVALTAVGMGRPASAAHRGVRLIVSPASVLVDDPVEVRATGVQPRRNVLLELATRDRVGVVWRSRTLLRADASGVVDTRSYMKPFWSMRPVGEPAATTQFASTRGARPTAVSLVQGGKTLARAVVLRSTEAPALSATETTLRREGFVGTYYSLRSTQRGPAVVALNGSGGGHTELPWAVIASHGYPTLSLGYFGEDGLPPTLKDVPLEYFEKALRWLGGQPGVDPRRLVVVGISRGGEAALLLGATYPELVHGVVACTPSADVLPPPRGSGSAWTMNGKPIALGPLPVESIGAPTWITGGGKDELADSAQAVQDLLARAKAHARANVNGAVYAGAGHAVGCVIPNQPLPEQFSLGAAGGYFERGGTAAANEAAAAASWPRLLALLRSV